MSKYSDHHQIPGSIEGTSIEIKNAFNTEINKESFPTTGISYCYGKLGSWMYLAIEAINENGDRKVFEFISKDSLFKVGDVLPDQIKRFQNKAKSMGLPEKDLSYFKNNENSDASKTVRETINIDAGPTETEKVAAKVMGLRLVVGIAIFVAVLIGIAIFAYGSSYHTDNDNTVIYDGNGGYCTITDDNVYKYEDSVTIKYSPEPTRDGYTFVGWTIYEYSKDHAMYKKGIDQTMTIRSDITFYAVWKEEIRIIYDVDGDTSVVVDSNVYNSGDKVTLKDCSVQKEDYYFYGWQDDRGIGAYKPGYVTTLYKTETYTAYWLPVCTYAYDLSDSISEGFTYQIDGYSYTYTKTPKDGYKFILATMTIENVNCEKSISVNGSMLNAVLSNSTEVDTAEASYEYRKYVAHDPSTSIKLNEGGSVAFHAIYEIPEEVSISILKPKSYYEGGIYDGYWMVPA